MLSGHQIVGVHIADTRSISLTGKSQCCLFKIGSTMQHALNVLKFPHRHGSCTTVFCTFADPEPVCFYF